MSSLFIPEQNGCIIYIQLFRRQYWYSFWIVTRIIWQDLYLM